MKDLVSGIFSIEHLREMKKGIELFNEQKYWECHEELERYWADNPGDEVRVVFWAVIQVATAMYHFREGNFQGVRGMMSKAQEKIERGEKLKVESDILEKYMAWEKFKALVKKNGDKLEDYLPMYNFRFPSNLSDWPV